MYPPWNYHGTWKYTPGKGDSYWKPSFLGAMLVSGRVSDVACFSSLLWHPQVTWIFFFSNPPAVHRFDVGAHRGVLATAPRFFSKGGVCDSYLWSHRDTVCKWYLDLLLKGDKLWEFVNAHARTETLAPKRQEKVGGYYIKFPLAMYDRYMNFDYAHIIWTTKWRNKRHICFC